jgi:2-desacetyl-2-hydroxyethyl bacteriochlorophyllide A dehydrogenase
VKALVLQSPHRFVVEERPAPVAAAGESQVRTRYVGICGTDLHLVEGTHPLRPYPRVLGHEMLGVATSGPLTGRDVVVDPLVSCGECVACRRGHRHVCERLQVMGVHCDGGLCDVVSIPERRLHPVPAGLDLEAAALTEPLAVCVHSTRRAGSLAGETVVIAGAGPIGLLLALTSRASGAREVLLLERSESRRALAGRYGFPVLDAADPAAEVRERTAGDLAGVVFDAAGAASLLPLLPGFLRPRGRLVLVALYGDPAPFDVSRAVFKELTTIASRVYEPEDIDAALALLAEGRLDVRPLVSDVIGFGEVSDACRRLLAREGMKVLIDCLRR